MSVLALFRLLFPQLEEVFLEKVKVYSALDEDSRTFHIPCGLGLAVISSRSWRYLRLTTASTVSLAPGLVCLSTVGNRPCVIVS